MIIVKLNRLLWICVTQTTYGKCRPNATRLDCIRAKVFSIQNLFSNSFCFCVFQQAEETGAQMTPTHSTHFTIFHHFQTRTQSGDDNDDGKMNFFEDNSKWWFLLNSIRQNRLSCLCERCVRNLHEFSIRQVQPSALPFTQFYYNFPFFVVIVARWTLFYFLVVSIEPNAIYAFCHNIIKYCIIFTHILPLACLSLFRFSTLLASVPGCQLFLFFEWNSVNTQMRHAHAHTSSILHRRHLACYRMWVCVCGFSKTGKQKREFAKNKYRCSL